MKPIESLRRAAKALKRAVNAQEASALARASTVFSPVQQPFKHADALHVIARETGYASWPRLKLAREMAEMDRDQRAERLKYALYFGQAWAVEALLAEDADLPSHDLGLQIATYDLAAVKAALSRDPAIATQVIGIRRPTLHLCFSKYIHIAPDKQQDMLAIAEVLVAHGADVNDGYASDPSSDHTLSALYGALGHADNMVLAQWLPEQGADPNDDESLYHSVELGHHRGLELLIQHQVRPNGTNALARALDFDDVRAVELLLNAGADPNEGAVEHPSGQPSFGIPSLHQAARRHCGAATAEILIALGAEGRSLYHGHSAYALARMYGNSAVAEVLARHGQATTLDAAEQMLAGVSEGPAAGRIEPAALTDEAKRLLVHVLQFDEPLAHAQRLVAEGIDPDCTDEMNLTALQIAAWQGHADAVRWLLTLNPDLSHLNAFGGDTLQTALRGAEFCPARDKRDHVGCVELLLAAGAEFDPKHLAGVGVEELREVLADWLER